ncbi:MAG: hypothetical protein IKO47_09240 [Ruminococcus sp.]|nr:hypothetical protein [Ruminococcus sp.]
MLGDILSELIAEFISEVIWNLIIKPIGLVLFYIFATIFQGIYRFFKFIYQRIAAAAAFVTSPIRRLFNHEKNNDIMEEPEAISELSSATVDDTKISVKYNGQ